MRWHWALTDGGRKPDSEKHTRRTWVFWELKGKVLRRGRPNLSKWPLEGALFPYSKLSFFLPETTQSCSNGFRFLGGEVRKQTKKRRNWGADKLNEVKPVARPHLGDPSTGRPYPQCFGDVVFVFGEWPPRRLWFLQKIDSRVNLAAALKLEVTEGGWRTLWRVGWNSAAAPWNEGEAGTRWTTSVGAHLGNRVARGNVSTKLGRKVLLNVSGVQY